MSEDLHILIVHDDHNRARTQREILRVKGYEAERLTPDPRL